MAKVKAAVSAIDIDDLVTIAKKRGIEWGVSWIRSQFTWMNIPLVWVFFGPFVEMIVSTLADEVELFGFKINSTFLTSAQAAEYRTKEAKLLGLEVTDNFEEWSKLNAEASKAFHSLVKYSA